MAKAKIPLAPFTRGNRGLRPLHGIAAFFSQKASGGVREKPTLGSFSTGGEFLHIANWDKIKKGQVTDVYFSRAVEILKAKNIHKHVTAEVRCPRFPDGYDYAVLRVLEREIPPQPCAHPLSTSLSEAA